MNAETLAEFIKEPSRLYQVSYQELKTLVMQYPYAQNLHLLLLEKSLMERHAESHSNLEKAAAHVPDRKQLFQLLKAFQTGETPDSSWLLHEGEVLVLKDLQALQPLEKEPLTAEPPPMQVEWSLPATMPFDFHQDEEEEAIIPEADLHELSPSPAAPAEESPEEVDRSYLVTIAGIAASGIAAARQTGLPMPQPIQPDTKPAPLPQPEVPAPGAPMSKKSFESWRRLQQPALARPALAPQQETQAPHSTPETPHKPHRREDPIKAIVHKSVADNEGLASETLADLLARQGSIDRAIKMYERLMLIFPEKSAYFAAKIEQLKII